VYASLFIADLLAECIPGHAFTLVTCDVQNMVAHVEVPVGDGCLDLHGMYAQLAMNCTYQRKMFPGLIFRPDWSPVVLLCFFSGKIVITGGKTMDDVYAGWNRLWPTLKGFVTKQASEQPSFLHGSHLLRRQKVSRRAKTAVYEEKGGAAGGAGGGEERESAGGAGGGEEEALMRESAGGHGGGDEEQGLPLEGHAVAGDAA